MRRIDWSFWASLIIVLLGGIFLFYALWRFVLVLFLPFLLAFALAFFTRPIVRFFAAKTKCTKRFCAVIVTLSVLLVVGGLSYLLCHRLLLEIQRLLTFLAEDSAKEDGKIAGIVEFFRQAWERLPFLSHLQRIEFIEELIGDPAAYLIGQLQQVLSALAGRLAGGVATILRRLPGVIFFLLVSVISCFYFALDYDRVRDVLARLLPRRVTERLPAWRRRVSQGLKRCLRAYFLLFLLTLFELFVIFVLLRVEYPFLIALLGAALDILPVLGVGTLLIPWAILALVMGNVRRGVGLLIGYGVITIIRQIAEPHLVGKSLGLHPLLMLIAFYVGLELFGFVGIFLGPVLAVIAKAGFEYMIDRRNKENA